jgi:hypothetical protein
MGSDQFFEKPPADVPETDVPEEEAPGTIADVDEGD